MRIVSSALGVWVAIVTLAADQLSKWWLIDLLLSRPDPIRVTGFFDLVMVWNKGISFGMLAEHGDAARGLFIIIAGIIMIFLAHWLRRNPPHITAWGIGLVIGGAIGNVIDRLRFGAVADFFSFHIGSYTWPAFNIADSAICIGVALLCLESMLTKKTP